MCFKKGFNSISINLPSFLIGHLGPPTIGLVEDHLVQNFNDFTVSSVYSKFCKHRLMSFR